MIRLHGIPIWVHEESFDQFCLGLRFQKNNLPFVKMRKRKLICLHAMCEHIKRRKTRATTISHGVLGGKGTKGASKRKIRHKPNQPEPKGPYQLWSHRRKPDHYKDPRQGGGSSCLFLTRGSKYIFDQYRCPSSPQIYCLPEV